MKALAGLLGAPPSALGQATQLHWAAWLLRLAVLGQCAGFAAVIFLRLGTGIGTYYFLEHAMPPAQVGQFERWAAYALLALGMLAFLRPHILFLLPIALLILLDAWARRFNGGVPFAEWTVYAQALRYLMPLALWALFSRRLSRALTPTTQIQTVTWILRIATAAVFITHGLEAWYQHPRFIDYIIGSSQNLMGLRVSEAAAGTLLRLIGVVDIAVALLLLARPYKAVFFWMAFWGLITALSRMTAFGFGAYYEVLLRFSHFLVPIAIYLLLKSLKELQAQVQEASADAPGVLASRREAVLEQG